MDAMFEMVREAELIRERDEAVALMEKNRDDANKFIAQLKAELEQERRLRCDMVVERNRVERKFYAASFAIGKLQDAVSRLWVAVTPDDDDQGLPQEHGFVVPGVSD